MERYNGVEPDPEGAFVYYDDAQHALDVERANRLAMEACVDRDVKAIKDLKAQLATLQAQLAAAKKVKADYDRWLSGGVYFATAEYEKHVADHGQQVEALQAQLLQVEGERDRLTQQLHTLYAKHPEDSCYGAMPKLRAEVANLRQLVEALPVLDMRFDSVAVGPLGWTVGGVTFGRVTEANAYSALLQYRATLAAQDAGAKLPAWVNEAMRLAPTQTNPPHPTEERHGQR